MIGYQVCSQVIIEDMFHAFEIGFSDYIVSMTMNQKDFEARFFGPEGNRRETSFIAYGNGKPIGLVLGGIRHWDGMKTMRCGTLCVAPDYRGKGVAQALLEYHKETAKTNGCKQLFLEVIKGNDRAVQFYLNHGYRTVYDLKYYWADVDILKVKNGSTLSVVNTSYEAIVEFRNSLPDQHINWQSDVESYFDQRYHRFFCALENDKVLGYIAMSLNGKINFIWVEPQRRMEGIAQQLIVSAAETLKIGKVTLSFPNNALLEGFARKSNFTKEAVEQFEMYLPL